MSKINVNLKRERGVWKNVSFLSETSVFQEQHCKGKRPRKSVHRSMLRKGRKPKELQKGGPPKPWESGGGEAELR